MARFAADSSDSGTEEEEKPQEVPIPQKRGLRIPSDVEDNDEDSGSEGSVASGTSASARSEMQEDELMTSPPRRRRNSKGKDRNALVQDENGDIRYAHEVDDRVSPASTSSRTSPRARTQPGPRGDPTVIPWAQHVGVDAQKMHVMQASFFRTQDEAPVNTQPKAKGPVARLDIDSKTLNASRKHRRDSDGDGLRYDSRERASFAHDIDPPVFRPSRKYARVDIQSSVANGSEGAYFDAGLAMGRSFRVGWGPGGQLVHLGSICSPTSTSHTSANASVVNLTKIQSTLLPSHSGTAGPSAAPTTESLAAKLLQHHLSHTTISKDDAEVPCAYPNASSPSSISRNANRSFVPPSAPLNFASFASLFPSSDSTGQAPIFQLGSALFDPLELHIGRSRTSAITPDLRNRIKVLRQKTALSKWLEDVVKPQVDGDLRVEATGSNAQYTAADAAFTYLSGHQITEACAKAADGGYIKLATLISQAGGDELFKQDLIAQLDIWKAEKLSPGANSNLTSAQTGLVGRGVWRVYSLLAGLVDHDDEKSRPEYDICVGLDWKRVFGLCLWYGTSVDASVADVVAAYERILLRNSRGPSNEVAQPVPKWALEKHKKAPQLPSLGSSRLGLFLAPGSALGSSDNLPEDPLYALIKVHADPALSLSKALNPLSFSSSGVDLGTAMCWHLYIILSRVMRVRDFADRGESTVQRQPSKSSKKSRASLVNGIGSSSRRGRDNGADSLEDDLESDEPRQDGTSPTANLLTSSYAFELEGWGMLQEAAFVLLHLEERTGREKAIKDLLARSAAKLDDWTVRGLVGSLKLPMTWIDEAKAMYELDSGNLYAAYELYLSAQLYNAAHGIAVLDLAPDAVIRKDHELLRNLFSPLNMTGRRDKIDGWFDRGQVFLDYANLMIRLPQLLDAVAGADDADEDPEDESANQAEEIDSLTERIPKIIAALPDVLHRSRSTDDRHLAALEEMTKDLLTLVEKAKPVLFKQIQQPALGVLDGASRINLVKGIGYARFLQSIEA